MTEVGHRINGRTEDAPAPVGSYSQSARVGPIVAASGQVGINPRTGHIISSDVASQTQQALENIKAVLAANGASMNDVVRVGVFLADVKDFQTVNEVYSSYFVEPFPARTTVCVLLPESIKVEIEAIAIVEPWSQTPPKAPM